MFALEMSIMREEFLVGVLFYGLFRFLSVIIIESCPKTVNCSLGNEHDELVNCVRIFCISIHLPE